MLNSKDFPQVYTDLGISTSNLGCIMLDTQPIVNSDVIKSEDYFVSEKDDLSFVKGNVSEDVPHVTLLYGLLRSGPEMQKHVDAVLTGWELPELIIDKISFFYSNDSDEHYVAIVALMRVTPELMEGNARLRFLPHIDTFPEYKPHVTLAYVKAESDWQSYVEALNEKYADSSLRAEAINYGN